MSALDPRPRLARSVLDSLNRTVEGVVNDDPIAKIRVIQFMFVMTSGLSAVAGGVAAKSVTLAAGGCCSGS